MEIHKPVVLNGTYVRSDEHHCHFPNMLQRIWVARSLRAYKVEDGDKFICAGCNRKYKYSGYHKEWNHDGISFRASGGSIDTSSSGSSITQVFFNHGVK